MNAVRLYPQCASGALRSNCTFISSAFLKYNCDLFPPVVYWHRDNAPANVFTNSHEKHSAPTSYLLSVCSPSLYKERLFHLPRHPQPRGVQAVGTQRRAPRCKRCGARASSGTRHCSFTRRSFCRTTTKHRQVPLPSPAIPPPPGLPRTTSQQHAMRNTS